ncbi:MAG: hypothetical protein Q7U57_02480 [Methylovulum sp.]|nr:hypothetical protein [Methylovulum sp.]
MDAITASTSTVRQQQNAAVSPASSQRTKGLESKEAAIEIRSDNDTDDSLKVAGSTVKLSDSAVKLSQSAPVTSSSKSASIDNNAKAQQSLNQLLSSFNTAPSQALNAHSNVTSGLVLKSLAT